MTSTTNTDTGAPAGGGVTNVRRWGRIVMVGAVLVFAARFFRLDWSRFVQDEPVFLAIADQSLRAGDIPTHSPLVGSSGSVYGPGPLWWWMAVIAVVGRGVERAMAATAVAVTAAQVAFVVSWLRRLWGVDSWRELFQGRRAVGTGLSLLFAGTMPWVYLWSRAAWDLSALVVPFVAIALLTAPRLTMPWLFLIGTVLGLGLTSHPMIVPVCVGVGVAVLVETGRDWWLALRRAVVLGVGALLPVLPWILHMLAHGSTLATENREPAAPFLRVFHLFRPGGTLQLSHLLETEWPAFQRFSWIWRLDGLDIVLTGLLAISVTAGWIVAVRSGRVVPRRIGIAALVASVTFVVYYAALGIGSNPHFQFPTAWISLGGVMVWISGIRSTDGPISGLSMSIVGVIGVVNVATLAALISFVGSYGGTQGITFGSTLQEQVRAVSEVCASAQSSPVIIANRTENREHTLKFHADRITACQAIKVQVCDGPCAGATHEISYANDVGGKLAVGVRR